MKKATCYCLFSCLFQLSALLSLAQVNPVWTNRYNGIGDFSNKFNDIVLDGSGNIYLTGSTTVSTNGLDIITVKLNSNGDTLWVRTYNGLGNNADKGSVVKVDASGNVFVAGTVDNDLTKNDFIVIKYNSTGDTLWTKRYNNSANQNDAVVDMAIDGSSNVYVTGKSNSSASLPVNDNMVTIMYNSSGVQQWLQTYNGSGNATDQPVAVEVDGSGNVFVSGTTYNSADDDYITIKYSSLGFQLWQKVFDGNSNDRAAAMCIDASSNVYVTGRSKNGNDDYYTIAYDSFGNILWTTSYDGNGGGNDRPAAIATMNGNVYVTGQSDVDISSATKYDFVTIKYDSFGNQSWATNYNGPGSNNDAASDIVVDAGGNVFVTGKTDVDPTTGTNNDYATVEYGPSGAQLWAHTYNGAANVNDGANAIAIDASGNSYVTGGSIEYNAQKDGTTIKYNSAGTQEWIISYNAIGDNSDNGKAICVDASNNSYVAGYTFGNGTDRDICVMKLNPQGDTVWVKKYDGSGNNTDEAVGVAVDGSGNVYVAGFTQSAVGSYDYITLKLNSNGDTVWTKKYNGAGNGSDKPAAMFLDAAANVYITGQSDADATIGVNYNIVTIKYSSAGAMLWTSVYNGGANGDDRGAAIVADASGNVFVTGRTFNGTNDDYVTIQYNSAGTQQWVSFYDGTHGNDRPASIALDNVGNVLVTGKATAANSKDDIATVQYNSGGTQQWVQLYNGTGNGNDNSAAVAVDASGNVFVAGQTDTDTDTSIANYDVITIKYDNAGTQKWVQLFDGYSSADDAASAIAVDTAGNVYIVGQSEGGGSSAPNRAYLTLEYDNAGNTLWIVTYCGPGNGSDGANAIALNGAFVYVTGGSWGTVSQKDIVTFKYNFTPLGIHESNNGDDLVTVFPNPSTGKLLVNVEQNKWNAACLRVTVYDLLGEKLLSHKLNENTGATSAANNSNATFSFSIDLSAQTNGIYTVEIADGENKCFKKVSVAR